MVTQPSAFVLFRRSSSQVLMSLSGPSLGTVQLPLPTATNQRLPLCHITLPLKTNTKPPIPITNTLLPIRPTSRPKRNTSCSLRQT